MKAYVVVGLGYGDEGKGSIVDALTRQTNARLAIRFNGGPQAAHNVVETSGRRHTFAQFGSGTLAGAGTLLSRFMLVDPLALANEEHALWRIGIRDGFERLYVDGQAVVITPYHQAINRAREQERGDARHGSCGMGCGETVRDGLERPEGVIRIADIQNADPLEDKLEATYLAMEEIGRTLKYGGSEMHRTPSLASLASWYEGIARLLIVVSSDQAADLIRSNVSVFEGAQGVLLDENYGFHPYTTWSNTTTDNARTLLREAGITDFKTIGVTRAYMTRHGAGPLVTEIAYSNAGFDDKYNQTGEWQGKFRSGYFDIPALRYALLANRGVDYLAVTHLDQIGERWHYCRDYRTNVLAELPRSIEGQSQLTERLFAVRPLYSVAGNDEACGIIADSLNVPIGVTSNGPTAQDKTFTAGIF